MSSQCPVCGQIVGYGLQTIGKVEIHQDDKLCDDFWNSEIAKTYTEAEHKEAVREALDRVLNITGNETLAGGAVSYSKAIYKRIKSIKQRIGDA